jgi:hypothetical protein
MPDPTYIAKGPYPLAHTSFDAKGTTTQAITNVASPPIGTVGPGPIDAPTLQRITDLEAKMTAVEAETAYLYQGTGVPAVAASNGSIFLRTDGTTADTAIYSRISGAWVAIKGA